MLILGNGAIETLLAAPGARPKSLPGVRAGGLHLPVVENVVIPGGEGRHSELANTHPLKAGHLASEFGEHAADLPVITLS